MIRRRAPRNPGVKIVKKIFFIIAVLFCLVQAFLWEWGLLLSDSLYTEKGSLKYYLTFPSDLISEAPEILKFPNTETTYSYSVGDGNAPGYEGVHYQSSESKDNIESRFMEYLAPKGYTSISKEVDKGENGDWERIHLRFRDVDKPETQVVVSLFHVQEKDYVGVKFTAYHW